MTGIISMNNNKITDMGNNDAVNKEYVDTNFLNKNGGAIGGDFSMNNYRITDLADPTSNNDAANKGYIDTNFLNKNIGAS